MYHPPANPTERRNQEIKKGLRLDLQGRLHRDWDLHLPKVLFRIRTRANAATGFTPSGMLLGTTLRRPGERRLPTPPISIPSREEQQARDHQ